MNQSHRLERGQGLVEYALILVLVAIVTIGILAVMGESIVSIYCKLVTSLQPDMDAPMCEQISLGCAGSGSGSTVSVEAQPSGLEPGDTVDRVEFYVDGVRLNTEYNPKYCFHGGDASCNNYNISSMSAGTHTIRAVAYTDSGASGLCEYSFNR
jgi:pilus assembly protein Flp/PilA